MKQLGLSVTKHTRTMIYRGQKVNIKTFGKGYYGRTLAYVILSDGVNYNEKEVEQTDMPCVYKISWTQEQRTTAGGVAKLNRLMN